MDKMREVLQGCIDCEDYGKGEIGDRLDFLNSYRDKVAAKELVELEDHIIALIAEKEKIWFEKGFSRAWEVFQQG